MTSKLTSKPKRRWRPGSFSFLLVYWSVACWYFAGSVTVSRLLMGLGELTIVVSILLFERS